MIYMVIEHYKEGAAPEIYRRARTQGRLLPPGLGYVSSWVDMDFRTCWQVMQTDDPALFEAWTSAWRDLVEFEIILVRSSAEAARVMTGQ